MTTIDDLKQARRELMDAEAAFNAAALAERSDFGDRELADRREQAEREWKATVERAERVFRAYAAERGGSR